jgi:hypothetical protein
MLRPSDIGSYGRLVDIKGFKTSQLFPAQKVLGWKYTHKTGQRKLAIGNKPNSLKFLKLRRPRNAPEMTPRAEKLHICM